MNPKATVQRIGQEPDVDKRRRADWAESLADHMALRNEMSRKALVQALAAIGVTVSLQSVGYWLRGEISPSPRHQAALAKVFRVPVRRLFPIEFEEAS